ncbi:hypothetical protein TorRG33x02_090030, partial [Trema orientale]
RNGPKVERQRILNGQTASQNNRCFSGRGSIPAVAFGSWLGTVLVAVRTHYPPHIPRFRPNSRNTCTPICNIPPPLLPSQLSFPLPNL